MSYSLRGRAGLNKMKPQPNEWQRYILKP